MPHFADERPFLVSVLLGTASFLVLFDSLAVATALPSIGAEFGLGPGALQWVVSLYSVSIGALLVLGGRVCDLWGRRRTMVASLVMCSGAGLLAGLATTLPLLLAGRVLQGIAAAFAIPAALATAATRFTEEPWRSRVFSVIAFAAWSAGLGGAMLGGLLTDHLGWRWIFLVTVPVGAVAAAAAQALLDNDTPRLRDGERLDVAGALLATAGLVALLAGLQQLGEGAGRGALVLGAGVAMLAVLVVVERRVAHPLVKPHLLKSRRMVGSYLAFGTYCAGYTALIVVGSLYVQDALGLSAAQAGLVLTPVLVAGIVSSTLSATILRRFTSRMAVTVMMVLCAAALTAIALLGTTVAALLPWLILWGLCAGPVFVGLTRECISGSAETDRGTASALFESTSHLGGAIAATTYLTLLGSGVDYRPTQLVGALVVASGAAFAFLILPKPGTAADPPSRSSLSRAVR